MNETIEDFTQAHVDALRTYARKGRSWGDPLDGSMTTAERQLDRAGLLEGKGWRMRTSVAGLSLLGALEAAKAGEIS